MSNDVFSVRNGLTDDISSLSDAIVTDSPISIKTVALTMVAAVSAAFIGVHAIRFIGFKSDFGLAAGAVLGGIAIDVIGKTVAKK